MTAVWQTPIVALAVMTWLAAPPKSLGEASQREAFRRQMTAKSKVSLTNIGQPPEIPLVPAAPPAPPLAAGASADSQGAAAGTTPADKAGDKTKDEKWWKDRVATANDKLRRDQMMSDALQSQINALKRDVVNLDGPAKQRKAREELQAATDELDRTQKMLEADRADILAIQDEARRSGVPPGWVK